ncbi:hypothetical protein N7478_000209 [Penicillium angulare]|uniref:uncharacterized protein n=1 Tax=Penicillium angulare TaxID=116970 RepID=UPI002540B09A|nr:uncharacterized protein N7478_000209 [Penicillium angulare]KAJ5290958.1 hypothetical protein N7478_000209 [Penicillium angulare]
MSTQPENGISVLSEFPDHDRLLTWNQTPAEAVNECVHSLIAKQWHGRTGEIAVDAWDGKFSFTELDHLSSILAAYLSGLGVGPEVIIPVCFEKSRWVLVAILGVMKAGGAFVLLDESQPLKRMQYVCKEVNAPMVVTSPKFATQGQELAEKVVVVNHDWLLSLSPNHNWVPPSIAPRNSVYVIFTSGSTGQPKGVVVEHASLSTSSMFFNPRIMISKGARVFQFSSYTWDISIVELLSSLIAGACVCIPSNDDRMSNITGALNSLRVTYLILTPTVARSLVPNDLPTLKTICLGGEAMASGDVEKWASRVNLINGYGPTECTMVSNCRQVSLESFNTRNIGNASGSLSWIVHPNDHHILMPLGAIGELLIEGPIVARGYLNRPDLTAAAFPNSPTWRKAFPLGTGPSRFYKTGDLCKYAPDGSIEFMGRRDTQVKFRGQRLELEEIEQHVQRYFPGSSWVCAVLVSRDADSTGRGDSLAVFIQYPDGKETLGALFPESNLSIPTDSFRNLVTIATKELREAVPGYMVPSAFFPIHKPPLMESGKVDTKSLKAQVASLSTDQLRHYSGVQVAKRVPDTTIERQLQVIWANVLGVSQDQIGADDDFFIIGGRSLDAMQVVIQARKNGLETLTVSKMFKTPILSALSKEIISAGAISTSCPVLNEHGLSVSDLDAGALGSFHPDQVVCVLPTTDFQRMHAVPRLKSYSLWNIKQSVDKTRLSQAFQTLANRHSILRTIFAPHAKGLVQVVLKDVAIQMGQETVKPADVSSFCQSFSEKDSQEALSPDELYFQPTLVSSSDDEHTLILRTNHAQYDIDGLTRIFNELVDIYHERELAPITGDFTLYMQHRLAQKNDKSCEFWRTYLEGASMTPINGLAATDAKRDIVFDFGAIPNPQPVQGITEATLSKAAWALTLARLNQKNDIVFGHTVNGRDLGVPGTEQVVGCCLNTAPIRVTINPNWTAKQLLEHVQSQYAQTMEYEAVEPSEIVKGCTPWPKGTGFVSTITHDHASTLPVPALEGGSTLLEPMYPPESEAALELMDWPVQVVTHSEESEFTMGIMAFNDTLSEDRAKWILGKFGEAITALANASPMATLDISAYED